MRRSPPLLTTLLTGLLSATLSACTSTTDQISSQKIFTVFAQQPSSGLSEGHDDQGRRYGVLNLLSPQQEMGHRCDSTNDQLSGYRLRLPDGSKALPTFGESDSDGLRRFPWRYTFEGQSWTWSSVHDLGNAFSLATEDYLRGTYGIQVLSIDRKVLELEGPIDGYKAYEVSGEVVYQGHPTKVDGNCVLNIGTSEVHMPFRYRFLDAGEVWKVASEEGVLMELSKATGNPVRSD